jgi:hypothetical protein
MRKTTLIAKSVSYYSDGDETAFFRWLDSIPCVIDYHGVHDELQINIAHEKVDKYDIRELIALFYRYNVELKQLLALDRAEFQGLLRDPKKYWHNAMFK